MTLEPNREVGLVSSGFGMPLLVLSVILPFRYTRVSSVSVSAGRNHVFSWHNGDGTSQLYELEGTQLLEQTSIVDPSVCRCSQRPLVPQIPEPLGASLE